MLLENRQKAECIWKAEREEAEWGMDSQSSETGQEGQVAAGGDGEKKTNEQWAQKIQETTESTRDRDGENETKDKMYKD